MQILESVKHSLYKIIIFIGIGYVLSSCIGSGDSYTSKICSNNCNGDFQYYIEVSNDRKKVRYVESSYYGTFPSNWIDIKNGGVSYLTTSYGYSSAVFEIKDNLFRINYGGNWGNWANLCENGYSYVKNTYSTGAYDSVKVEVNNGQIRLCYKGWWNNYQLVCGNWVNFDYNYVCQKCPQGYTYNPNRNICEADPIINYTCPYVGGTCVEQSKGVAYCSPYNCNSTSIGTWCATGNINTTNMNANSIGMWQCSYDSNWFTDEASCKTGCNYFQCSYNNNWYQGDKSVCELNCREQGQCTEVNQ